MGVSFRLLWMAQRIISINGWQNSLLLSGFLLS
jgi:hypothetical protein